MEPLLSIEQATLGYNRKALLAGVNVEIAPDDFLAIVGPNGGGKSTLMRTMLGVLKPVSGRLTMRAGLRVGYVPQRDHVDAYWPLTVADVVMMGRVRHIGIGRRARPADRERVGAALARVGIGDLDARQFRTLSGGQRQRTLIARALAAEPELLALDEPTSGMDPAGELATMDILRELHSAGSLAIVMVSHRLEAVANYARRIAFVDKDRGRWRLGPLEGMLDSESLSDLYGRHMVVRREDGQYLVYPARGGGLA